MNETLKQRCLDALRSPSDPAALRAVVAAAEKFDPPLGRRLRTIALHDASACCQSCLEAGQFASPRPTIRPGRTPLEGVGIGMHRLAKLPHLMVRVLSFRSVVLFGCECLRLVLPLFERRRPNVLEPAAFVQTALAWASGSVSAGAMQASYAELRRVVNEIDDAWDAAYESGPLDAAAQEELQSDAAMLYALAAAAALGRALVVAGDSARAGELRLAHIDDLINHCIEAELLEYAPAPPTATIEWMQSRLAEFVESEPTQR